MVPYSIPYFILALAPNSPLRPLRKLSAFSTDLFQKQVMRNSTYQDSRATPVFPRFTDNKMWVLKLQKIIMPTRQINHKNED
jgi:hypothetical protein